MQGRGNKGTPFRRRSEEARNAPRTPQTGRSRPAPQADGAPPAPEADDRLRRCRHRRGARRGRRRRDQHLAERRREVVRAEENPRHRHGRLPRLGLRRGAADRGVRRVARRRAGAGGTHLHAGRHLGTHRGEQGLPAALGTVATRRARPDARAQRADAGAQRGGGPRPRGASADPPRRRRSLRPPLPHPGPTPGRTGRPRHGDRAGLGDERHHLHPPLRAGPGGLEGVLEAHRRHHAVGGRTEIPLRFRAQPRKGRHRLDRVLSR